MTHPKSFPINPFPDVKPNDFHKLNKKHVSEDYVGENFKLINWDVFAPFNDTGIDRIISKYICPNGHTKYNENLNTHPCPHCDTPSYKIYRFIQIKTRELKGVASDTFGYTLKTKDFRTDPRHIFLFYSDHTNDFILVSVYDYLNFFEANHDHFHASPTFKQGNGKINNLKYDANNDSWTFKNISWDIFRNIPGIEKIQNPDYDKYLDRYINDIDCLKRKLFYEFSSGRTFATNIEQVINQYIKQTSSNPKSTFLNIKSANIHKLRALGLDIVNSINGYYAKFKGLHI